MVVYQVQSGNPFALTKEKIRFFSTEEKARHFIEEDCERLANAYHLTEKKYWDNKTFAEIGSYHYVCGNITYRMIKCEVL